MSSDIIEYNITLKILEIYLNSIEKAKPGFLLSLMYMFHESNWKKP